MRPLDAYYVLKDGQSIQAGGGFTVSNVVEDQPEIVESTLLDGFGRPNPEQVYTIEIQRDAIE